MAGRSDTAASGRYVQGGRVEVYPDRLGWWQRRNMPKHPSDLQFFITPRYHKRPDLLAYDMYGTAKLSWFVLQFNNIIDINLEFIEGKSVMLPTKTRVYTELTTRQQPLDV